MVQVEHLFWIYHFCPYYILFLVLSSLVPNVRVCTGEDVISWQRIVALKRIATPFLSTVFSTLPQVYTFISLRHLLLRTSIFCISSLTAKVGGLSAKSFRSLASTYVTFDSSGRYLLANLVGEQIYLYDCSSPQKPMTQTPLSRSLKEVNEGQTQNGHSCTPSPCALPSIAEQLKSQLTPISSRNSTRRLLVCTVKPFFWHRKPASYIATALLRL